MRKWLEFYEWKSKIEAKCEHDFDRSEKKGVSRANNALTLFGGVRDEVLATI